MKTMHVTKESIRTDRKTLISALWIFVLMNMIYADIIGMLRPGYLELLDRVSRELTPEMVLTFSILLEIPIAMILLSRILKYKANRITNLIAIPITMVFVIYGGTDNPPYSYLFFGSIEIVSLLVIAWYAWRWPKPEINSGNSIDF